MLQMPVSGLFECISAGYSVEMSKFDILVILEEAHNCSCSQWFCRFLASVREQITGAALPGQNRWIREQDSNHINLLLMSTASHP